MKVYKANELHKKKLFAMNIKTGTRPEKHGVLEATNSASDLSTGP